MKKMLYIMGVVLAIASCTKDEEVASAAQADGYVSLTAGSPTRVSADGLDWSGDEELLVVTKSGEATYSYLNYTISNAGTGAMSPDNDSDKIISGEELTYYAYYPRDDSSDIYYTCDLTTSQEPLLTAQATSSSESVNLQFKHQYARLTINLVAGEVTDFTDAKVTISGAYLKGKYNAVTNSISNPERVDLTLSVIGTTATSYIIPYATAIDVVVKVGDDEYATKIAHQAWAAGKSYQYNIKVGED